MTYRFQTIGTIRKLKLLLIILLYHQIIIQNIMSENLIKFKLQLMTTEISFKNNRNYFFLQYLSLIIFFTFLKVEFYLETCNVFSF